MSSKTATRKKRVKSIVKVSITDGTKKCLVLDLDETLVYTFETPEREYHRARAVLPANRTYAFRLGGKLYWGIIRPYTDLFLAWAFNNFDIVGVYSAGDIDYVEEVVKSVFGTYKPYFVWARDRCVSGKRDFYKPLTKLYAAYPEIDPNNTLIIDDKTVVATYNPQNLIEIPKYRPLNYQLYDSALIWLIQWLRAALEIVNDGGASLVDQDKSEINFG